MNYRARQTGGGLLAIAIVLSFFMPARGRAQAPPPAAKAAAPIDLTGYWVAIMTQDWKQRMVTPPKGDYAGIPITVEAKKVGDAWDPAKDEAAGEQCKSYGAPGLMRAPTRLHVTWQDDNTLKVETDYGMQARLLHFGKWKAPGGAATLQGDSVAQWETPPTGRGAAKQETPKSGSLKIVTTHLKPGYLRKNGVPYGANAVLTEYWDLVKEHTGEQWIEITNTVDDSQYLRQPWVTTLHFKKEPDGAKWDPTPCSATW
jgi:hypothetical protein